MGDVEDDVVECTTEVEEKCEDETSGYTTNTKCSKWPREVCSVSKKQVKKYTPITDVPRSPGSSVPPLAVASSRVPRSVTTKLRPLCRMPPRSSVPWNLRGPAST